MACSLPPDLHHPQLDVPGLAASAGSVLPSRRPRTCRSSSNRSPAARPRLGAALPVAYDVEESRLHGPGGLGGVTFPRPDASLARATSRWSIWCASIPRTLPWSCLARSRSLPECLTAIRAALPNPARGLCRGDLVRTWKRQCGCRSPFHSTGLARLGAPSGIPLTRLPPRDAQAHSFADRPPRAGRLPSCALAVAAK